MSYVLPVSSFSTYLSPDFSTVPEKTWLSEPAAPLALEVGLLWSGGWLVEGDCVDGEDGAGVA